MITLTTAWRRTKEDHPNPSHRKEILHDVFKKNMASGNSPYPLRAVRRTYGFLSLVREDTKRLASIARDYAKLLAWLDDGYAANVVYCGLVHAKTPQGEFARAWSRNKRRVNSGEWNLVYPAGQTNHLRLQKKLPWPLFPHQAKKDPEKIAYYRNLDAFLRDIQTVTSAGKFIKTWYSDLCDADVKRYAERHLSRFSTAELHISTDRDDFIEVMKRTPGSCMNRTLEYRGGEHPGAAYASGDIEILWIENPDNKQVEARALANKATRRVARIYGDEARMLAAMSAHGYAQEAGALKGCRLLCIEAENSCGEYLMPYVDAGVSSGGGALGYRQHDNDHFILVDEADGESTYCGYEHGGMTGSHDSICCHNCDCRVSEDDVEYIEDEPYCSRCVANYFCWSELHQRYLEDEAAYCCVECQQWFLREDVTQTYEENYACQDCLDRDYTWCCDVEAYVERRNACLCARCGEYYLLETCKEIGSELFCAACAQEIEEEGKEDDKKEHEAEEHAGVVESREDVEDDADQRAIA